jgi:hypothetical protein
VGAGVGAGAEEQTEGDPLTKVTQLFVSSQQPHVDEIGGCLRAVCHTRGEYVGLVEEKEMHAFSYMGERHIHASKARQTNL